MQDRLSRRRFIKRLATAFAVVGSVFLRRMTTEDIKKKNISVKEADYYVTAKGGHLSG